MRITTKVLAYCFLVGSVLASAQTTVTTNGVSANTLPLATGSSTIGNSNVYQSSGKIGIGTNNPASPLDVNGAIAIAGTPISDFTQLATPTNGTYVIASGGRIKGEYILSVEGPNQVQTVHLVVNANQYDPAPVLQILENHSYNQNTVLSNFRLLISADHSSELLVMTVNNANSGMSVGIQYQGSAKYSAAFGGTLVGNESAIGQLGFISNEGKIGIGTLLPAEKLEVNGNLKLTNGTGASIIFSDNSIQTTAWTGTLCGGDYAESIDIAGKRDQYEPGDLLVIDPTAPGKFLKSAQPYSSLVAGIYSTKPGMVGRRQQSDPKISKGEIPMAMIGIVPTKVSAENGPIKSGDLLVTSGTLGHAMKGTDRTLLTGAVVGKALGNLEVGVGTIEVLVTLQ